MRYEGIEEAQVEAKRFMRRLNKVIDRTRQHRKDFPQHKHIPLDGDDGAYMAADTAALKRASLDLSKILSKLRRVK